MGKAGEELHPDARLTRERCRSSRIVGGLEQQRIEDDQYGDRHPDKGLTEAHRGLATRYRIDPEFRRVETTIRVMTRWQREGVLETQREGFVIRDPDQLGEVAAQVA